MAVNFAEDTENKGPQPKRGDVRVNIRKATASISRGSVVRIPRRMLRRLYLIIFLRIFNHEKLINLNRRVRYSNSSGGISE